MKYALNLAEDGHILSVTFEKYASPDSVIVDELPDGDISDYRWQDDSFVYDPIPKPEPVEPKPTTDERIATLEEQIIQADETAIALYEAQEAQEVISTQQDEALMEIYEMIG